MEYDKDGLCKAMRIEHWYLEALAKDMYTAKQRVETLSHQVYPSEALRDLVAQELREAMIALWSSVEKQLGVLRQNPDAPLSPECETAIMIWKRGYMQSVIASVSEADIHSHPLEMMLYIRDLAATVVPNEIMVVVAVPQEMLNYTVREIWDWLRPSFATNFGLKSHSNVKYVELAYPRSEKDNILMSTVYAHELGHYVDYSLNLALNLRASAYSRVLAKLPEIRQHGSVPRSVSDLALADLIVSKVLVNWIAEAIADCFATRVLGPAYFFCHAELQGLVSARHATGSIYVADWASTTHPRVSRRVEYQRALLSHMKSDLPQQTRDAIVEVSEMFQTSSEPRAEDIVIRTHTAVARANFEVYMLVEEIWMELQREITAVVDRVLPPEVIFTAEDYAIAVDLVTDRLEMLIPPNEQEGQPVNPAVIINAGWHAKQFSIDIIKERIASLPEGLEGTHAAVDTLNGLLQYALYASYVHGRWKAE